MVQEFDVLRCFSCQTFQVHQVKKSKKWNCKMCGEKQSFVKVYGRGSGADCRRHVQKLNSLRGELQEAEHAPFSWEPEGEEEELQDEGDEALNCENQQGVVGTVSRWSKFLSPAGEEAEPEEAGQEANVYMVQKANRSSLLGCTRNAGKRKRSWGFSTPSRESASPESSGADQSAVKDPWNRTNQRTQCERKHDSNSKISHDTLVISRPPPVAEAPPPPGARGAEPEARSSKWSRFLSARREDAEEDEEEAPQKDIWAGTSRGKTGSEEPQGFPSLPIRVFTGRFEEHGHLHAEVQEDVRLTDRVFAGISEKSPESKIDGLRFSPGYPCIQKVASHGHLNSGLPASAVPVRPQNLSISKPHPFLHSLFQTDEDFDDTF